MRELGEFRDGRSIPERVIEGSLHIVGYERRPAQRARPLLVPHPTVKASPVEYVPAVSQPSDLVLPFELVQTHCAALLRGVRHLTESDHREDFPDEECGDGLEFGVQRVLVDGVGFQEILEAKVVAESGNEFSEERKGG
ncbi:hypothetical protein PIB30_000672 [Stylosanthes scabra]|uniref:Uncharacterized protein n=1 Tax=Stylosanthes scabra TaxID=79078 RepID=A0ABU6Y4D3_9FABA|nr:hypothetical protein [Stylosanthes scabra]